MLFEAKKSPYRSDQRLIISRNCYPQHARLGYSRVTRCFWLQSHHHSPCGYGWQKLELKTSWVIQIRGSWTVRKWFFRILDKIFPSWMLSLLHTKHSSTDLQVLSDSQKKHTHVTQTTYKGKVRISDHYTLPHLHMHTQTHIISSGSVRIHSKIY